MFAPFGIVKRDIHRLSQRSFAEPTPPDHG
jgi:hypothetical protein